MNCNSPAVHPSIHPSPYICTSAAQTSGELQEHVGRRDRGQLQRRVAAPRGDGVERGAGQPHRGPARHDAPAAGRRHHAGDQHADRALRPAQRRVRQVSGAPQGPGGPHRRVHEHQKSV